MLPYWNENGQCGRYRLTAEWFDATGKLVERTTDYFWRERSAQRLLFEQRQRAAARPHLILATRLISKGK